MRRMSFALTKKQVADQTKTVTRRNRWRNLKVGDRVQPIEKGMGLKKGEKQVLIGNPITVIDVRFEPLSEITPEDVIKEGFPEMTTEDFIEMYCKANNCDRDYEITRIEFTYNQSFDAFLEGKKKQCANGHHQMSEWRPFDDLEDERHCVYCNKTEYR